MTSSEAQKPSPGTLGWIQYLYETEGREASLQAFELAVPGAIYSSYRVVRRSQGAPSLRTDILETDAITYTNFSPPALWGTPYSLLKMVLSPKPKEDVYVVHSGEELLVPTTGRVRYVFYGGTEKSVARRIEEDFAPDEFARINPAVPHHGWAIGESTAEAWLALYHDPDSSAAFDLETRLRQSKAINTRRRFQMKDLADQGQYALAAWGISDRIRTQRQRANLTIAQLSEMVHIDASHISRIENAATNVSLDVLKQICKFLRIDLGALVASANWHLVRTRFDADIHKCMSSPPGRKHQLHPVLKTFDGGQAISTVSGSKDSQVTSWIVLRGKAIAEIQGGDSGLEILEEGTVIHFRNEVEVQVQPLMDTVVLQIALSPVCHRGSPKSKS